MTAKRALLVVDYAESRTELKDLLVALAGEHGRRVRVLLLARSAGEWLDQVGAGDQAVRVLTQAAIRSKIQLTAQVRTGQSDGQIVAAAAEAFAARRGVQRRTVRLTAGGACRPILDLHAAALVAVLDSGSSPVVTVDVATVLEDLLGHEEKYWYQTAGRA